jgi:hypothetical protein
LIVKFTVKYDLENAGTVESEAKLRISCVEPSHSPPSRVETAYNRYCYAVAEGEMLKARKYAEAREWKGALGAVQLGLDSLERCFGVEMPLVVCMKKQLERYKCRLKELLSF